MDTIRMCHRCAKPLPASAPEGLCPECLAKVALGSDPKPSGTRVPPTVSELAAHFPQLEIIEFLGMGGMGMVYKARQPRVDRLVALKILPMDSAHGPSFAERFQREARALARLNHPGIVTFYDFGQTSQYCYFIMEYVDGANLRQLLSAKTIEPRQALELVTQICTALQFAHDEGIVHRDIKPENVLVNKKGQVKIADFGLAKLMGAALDTSLTMPHAAMGTFNYMAPEQRADAQKVDHRADIYSLGVVFYEMLTGEIPMGRFEPPSKRVQVDVRLDEVVLHALEREPDRRYQHASEVRTDVQNVAGASKPAATPATPLARCASTGKPWPAWVWWTLLILATLPFLRIAELNRAAEISGHATTYGEPWILLVAIGSFAAIKLLELRLTRAGQEPIVPFSQPWLGIIFAAFGVCVLAVGPFPYVEWLHETLQVFPAKVANATGATVELAGFSETFVQHGSEFWQGRVIALIGVVAPAFLLIAPRRLGWHVARSALLVVAGTAIAFLAVELEVHGPQSYGSGMSVLEFAGKSDPTIRQFCDDFKQHKAAEAASKSVSTEALEKLGDSYGSAYAEYKPSYGLAVCACAALELMLLGAVTFRQTTKSSAASFVGWHRVMEQWGSLLLLGPCLFSVLSGSHISDWVENVAWIPLFDGKSWVGDWVKASRLPLAGVGFWQGQIIAAVCIAAILAVAATALRGWRRGARAMALSLAGLVSIACATDFRRESLRDTATVSWDDFQTVAQHGAPAAGSAETRRFLAAHPLFVGQLVELEENVQALAATLLVPYPNELPKKAVTTNADGTTITTTISSGMPFLSEARKAQAQRLAQGGGVVSLYQNSGPGPFWPAIFGVGLLLAGIRDAKRTWLGGQDHQNRESSLLPLPPFPSVMTETNRRA